MRRTTLLLFALGLAGLSAPNHASAQSMFWFDAGYLFWGRANTSDRTFITGGAGSASADYGLGNGYRLALGATLDRYEVEAIFTRVEGWGDGSGGVLASPLALDNTAGNPILFPGGAATLGFANGLFDAATLAAETSEGEFLVPGAATSSRFAGDLRDIQVNLSQSRLCNFIRWGVGYRNLRILDGGGFTVAGTFNALDVDDGLGPGAPANNDPNDQLAHASLLAAGYTNVGGLGDGYDAIYPLVPTADGLTALFNGQADNNLNGVQLTMAVGGSPTTFLTIDGFLRVGLFHNQVQGSYYELLSGSRDDDSVYYRGFAERRNRAAFGVNPGFKLSLDVTEFISITTGYELLFLTGVANGPDQIGQARQGLLGAPVYVLDSSGTFFGHGGNIGLQIRW